MSDLRTRNAVVTAVSTSTTAAQLYAGDTSGPLSVYNDSSVDLYLLCGPGDASSTNFTVKLATQSYWEAPYNYSGRISGILASSTGTARVTAFK